MHEKGPGVPQVRCNVYLFSPPHFNFPLKIVYRISYCTVNMQPPMADTTQQQSVEILGKDSIVKAPL